MSLWNAIVVGLKEIWAHKFRSMLTMLGIILGVSSLVAMNALVQGMENGARESLVAVGGLSKVRVEAQPVPVEQRHMRDLAVGVTMNDVYALQHSAPEATLISPEMRLDGFNPTLAAKGKTYRTWMTAGVWPVQLDMMEHKIAHGRMFTQMDDEMARNVVVIGTGIRDELFGKPEETGEPVIPIGETLTINGYPFTVIGMFEHYESEQERKTRELREKEKAAQLAAGVTNQSSGLQRSRGGGRRGSNFAFWIKNNTVYMPLNTMWMKMKSGQSNAPAIPTLNSIEIRVADPERIGEALTQVRNVLMVTHRGIEDFSFRTQEDWADQINTFISSARTSGGLIAGISLLVGGIGIMNIMLASISERIREIGIRKAVGAGDVEVFVQIIIESTVIAIIGGAVGLATSFGLIQLIASVTPTDNAPVVTFGSMAIAFGASVSIGVFAGLIPAFRAARMNVIQALRYD